MRLAAALGLLLAQIAAAQTLEGVPRVSVEGGWRLTPNDSFAQAAAAANDPLSHPSPGGPALAATFGYSVNDLLEVDVDLFAGGEQLVLATGGVNSVTYGAAAGARVHWPLDAFVPYVGVLTGPMLINLSGALPQMQERYTQGYLFSGGAFVRVGGGWAVTLEYRLLLARGWLDGVGSVNGGGSWFGLGVSYLFASEPTRHD